MIPPAPPVTIADEEALARYVYVRSHIRADGTLRPDALIPHPYPDLSVNRHHGLTEEQVWAAGRTLRPLPLVGRADISARAFRTHRLRVHADPVEGNPRHALVLDWPAEKSAQKSIVQQLLATAVRYHAAPVA